jgi:hypothetical protein
VKSNRGIGVPILQFDPIEAHIRHWEELPRQQQKATLFVQLVDTPTDNKCAQCFATAPLLGL